MPFPTTARLLLPVEIDYRSVLARSQMESGPPKQKKTLSLQPVHHKVRYRLTPDEYDQFLAWYRDEIDYGAQFFTWTDLAGVDRQGRIVDGEVHESQHKIADDAPLEYEIEYTLEVLQ